MPHTRSGLPFPVKLIEPMLHTVMPVKLCCPLRIAWISGYVNAKGFSPGLLNVSATTSFGLLSPGTGFSNAELIQLKIVVFAPMPSASVRIAIAANPGAFAIIRKLYRTSCQIDVIRASCSAPSPSPSRSPRSCPTPRRSPLPYVCPCQVHLEARVHVRVPGEVRVHVPAQRFQCSAAACPPWRVFSAASWFCTCLSSPKQSKYTFAIFIACPRPYKGRANRMLPHLLARPPHSQCRAPVRLWDASLARPNNANALRAAAIMHP